MLTDKICLITGAGGGIGTATAVEMGRQGAAAVVVADLHEERCDEACQQLAGIGTPTIVKRCDVTEAASVEHLMAVVGERFGHLDVLHNNAGISETQMTAAARIDTLAEALWDAVFAVNVKGVWLCTKHATPLLRAGTRAAIVNTASIAGLHAFPDEPAYAPSKAAVIQLTRTTALDLVSDGVRCNCVCPGPIDTPMLEPFEMSPDDRLSFRQELTRAHLVPRLGAPEDVAKLVCFLASDDAAFVNGAAYTIDGGALAWRGLR